MLENDERLIKAECELQNVERQFTEQARIVSKMRVGSHAAHVREAALARLKDDMKVKRKDCFRLLADVAHTRRQDS